MKIAQGTKVIDETTVFFDHNHKVLTVVRKIRHHLPRERQLQLEREAVSSAALKKQGKRDARSYPGMLASGGSPPFAGNCSFPSGAIFPHAGVGKFRPYGVSAARAAARHG